MQDFAVIGLDLAISVFRVHGVGRAASASSWNAPFYTSGTQTDQVARQITLLGFSHAAFPQR